ncbi:mycothiol system anti-sigma-R factor [Saccharothrix carnea]|uniref:Mycothiol system anti-sigma-R factor n=1 Tax=Saccharothrix carnea TaxID=1280637 RepID=A0A2P8IJN1_SACCR|nr:MULTISPECIES: mycothiol system anti-sigma-R factor [Saccharothrix]OKI31248.1 mycothiol system anti-sigma-R factor [Saccharothrix sp. CB00851]PSL58651.1 mycothiol system anti-sigma-R factor [Saccharothrix carnea]
MSCGKPHETDCSEVLSEVYLFLDHECDQKRKELLQTHLEECHPCLEQYGIEEHLKALLARKCGGEHAPEELRRRLRARLYQTADQTTVEVEVTTTVTRTETSNS